jgi:hypothetical protein
VLPERASPVTYTGCSIRTVSRSSASRRVSRLPIPIQSFGRRLMKPPSRSTQRATSKPPGPFAASAIGATALPPSPAYSIRQTTLITIETTSRLAKNSVYQAPSQAGPNGR